MFACMGCREDDAFLTCFGGAPLAEEESEAEPEKAPYKNFYCPPHDCDLGAVAVAYRDAVTDCAAELGCAVPEEKTEAGNTSVILRDDGTQVNIHFPDGSWTPVVSTSADGNTSVSFRQTPGAKL